MLDGTVTFLSLAIAGLYMAFGKYASSPRAEEGVDVIWRKNMKRRRRKREEFFNKEEERGKVWEKFKFKG